MSDDWRLQIQLADAGEARSLGRLLGSSELEHDLDSSFSDRVVVSVDDDYVFCYAGSREQADRAQRLIGDLAARHGFTATLELARWHPIAERWEDPDAPLPTGEAIESERQERIARERGESAEQGYPELEVRVKCDSRRAARDLSERLEREEVPNVHRWNFVLVGATDEDSAQQLAQQLRAELGDGADVAVEANARAVYEDRPWSPFSVLGGLGG